MSYFHFQNILKIWECTFLLSKLNSSGTDRAILRSRCFLLVPGSRKLGQLRTTLYKDLPSLKFQNGVHFILPIAYQVGLFIYLPSFLNLQQCKLVTHRSFP